MIKLTNKTARLAAILLYLTAIAVTAATAASEIDGDSEEKTGADPDAHGSHPVTAILFPWFAEIIGVLVFFVLSVSAAF